MEETEEIKPDTKPGKPWKNEGFYTSFEEADGVRQKLNRIWEGSEQHKGMQVKVKWSNARQQFMVKTRLHPDFEPVKEVKKETTKNGKGKRRNKKNTDRTKFDPTASV